MYGMLYTALYDIVDMFFIGMIGKEAVAATTIYLTLFWTLQILNEIIGTSSVSLLSRSWGAKKYVETQRIGEQTLIFKALLGGAGSLLVLAVLPFFLRFYTSDPTVIHHGMRYGVVRTFFIAVFFASYSNNTIFRATGDAKTPMHLALITAVLNTILDPLFMFDTIPYTSLPGFGWGMAGAALATGISYLVAFLIGLYVLSSGKAAITLSFRGLLRLDWKIDKQLLTIGLPSGINVLLGSLLSFVFLRVVAVYGTAAIAAIGVASRIYQLARMPAGGLSSGSGFLVGQRLGGGNSEEAKRIIRLSIFQGLLFTLPLTLLLICIPIPLLSLFLERSAIDNAAILLLQVYGLCLLPGVIIGGLASAFFGSGYVKPLLYSFIISGYLVQLPYGALVALLFQLPLGWLWGAFLLGDCIECVVLYRWVQKGKWITNA